MKITIVLNIKEVLKKKVYNCVSNDLNNINVILNLIIFMLQFSYRQNDYFTRKSWFIIQIYSVIVIY